MKRIFPRLQGLEWHNMKESLILIRYRKSINGHIKGIYKDKFDNKYTHWLNDEEIEELSNNIKIMKEGIRNV